MQALYFFLRDNDDDDNGQKTPSANNDDYHSYKQVLVITLNKISEGGAFEPSTSSRQKSMLSTLTLRFVRFYDLFSLPVCCARDV